MVRNSGPERRRPANLINYCDFSLFAFHIQMTVINYWIIHIDMWLNGIRLTLPHSTGLASNATYSEQTSGAMQIKMLIARMMCCRSDWINDRANGRVRCRVPCRMEFTQCQACYTDTDSSNISQSMAGILYYFMHIPDRNICCRKSSVGNQSTCTCTPNGASPIHFGRVAYRYIYIANSENV